MDLPFLTNNNPPKLYPESGYVYPNIVLTDTLYAQKTFMRCSFTNDPEQIAAGKESLKTFKQVAILCGIFMVSEFVGGLISNSVAVYSDALHMLSDMTGYFINIFGLKLSIRKPSPFFTFGSRRVEIVGAIFSILLIWVLSLFLIMQAVTRILHPRKVSGPVMTLVATLGIVTNILIAAILSRSGHGHSHFGISHGHGHSPSSTRRPSQNAGSVQRNASSHTTNSVQSNKYEQGSFKRSSTSTGPNFAGNEQTDDSYNEGEHSSDSESHVNISIKSAYLHTLGDLLQNIGVLLAGVMIWVKPNKFLIMDPICTLFFAFNVFAITVPTSMRCFYVLMDTVPKNFDTVKILTSIRNIKFVQDVKDFHVWSVGMESLALTVMLDVTGGEHGCHCSKRSMVSKRVRKIANDYGIEHCNVEITENCLEEKWVLID